MENMQIDRNVKNESWNLIRSHVSMVTTVTIIIISVITKIENSNSNKSDYQKRWS